MNKLTKATIAGAAGVVLLLGGAGTLAYWNSSADLDDAGTVSTGTLAITSAGAGTWTEEIDFLVPGDSTTYAESFNVTAVGDRLAFDLTTNIDSIVSPAALDSLSIDESFEVRDANNDLVTDLSGIEEGVYTVTVTVEVDFPIGTTGNQVDQNVSIDLSAIAVSVTQQH